MYVHLFFKVAKKCYIIKYIIIYLLKPKDQTMLLYFRYIYGSVYPHPFLSIMFVRLYVF